MIGERAGTHGRQIRKPNERVEMDRIVLILLIVATVWRTDVQGSYLLLADKMRGCSTKNTVKKRWQLRIFARRDLPQGLENSVMVKYLILSNIWTAFRKIHVSYISNLSSFVPRWVAANSP